MRKVLFAFSLLCTGMVMAQTQLFYESFNKNENDGEYMKGYTGGNDGEWGGDVAKAIVIYYDNNDGSNFWDAENCSGADRCIKVGSDKGGSITTPAITCSGDIKLTFRAAPWMATKEDSVINISVSSGELDVSSYTIHTKKWNDISVRIYDVENSVKITFSSGNKNRFFLDEVKVFTAAADDAYLRVSPKGYVSFGTFGTGYAQQSKDFTIESGNITSAGVSVAFDDAQHAYVLDKSKMTTTGGKLSVSCKTGMPAGEYGATLKISAVSAKDASVKMEKVIYLGYAVATTALNGDGTKANPYSVSEALTLWNDWIIMENEWIWIRGYILGGASTSGGALTGISKYDDGNLVLAASATESDVAKMIPVQIKGDAKTALNVYNHPDLIGREVAVYGKTATYLEQFGLKEVKDEDQYVLLTSTDVETVAINASDETQPVYDVLGRRVGADYHGIVIQNGQKWLR